MKSKLRTALTRGKYAAVGAAIGAGLGGLVGRQTASTGGAVGGLVGALVGETCAGDTSYVADLKKKVPSRRS